jgi:hypothetical protein
MRLPEWIRKVYVLCGGADSIEQCRKCPFFRLPEERFFCCSDRDVLHERIESEIEYGELEEEA